MSAAVEAVLVTNREIASGGGIRLLPWLARGVAGLRQLAPYAAIELILPGGSLIALVLWLYRRKKMAVKLPGLADHRPVGNGRSRHQ